MSMCDLDVKYPTNQCNLNKHEVNSDDLNSTLLTEHDFNITESIYRNLILNNREVIHTYQHTNIHTYTYKHTYIHTYIY